MYVDNRDWVLYNERLGERGDVIGLFFKGIVPGFKRELRKTNKKKRGRPFKYPNSLVEAGFKLKCILHFGYRQIQHLLDSLCSLVQFTIPNFRTLWWRTDSMEKHRLRVNFRENEKIDVAVDATGLKTANDGEYRTAKYGKRKVWIKLHANINVSTHEAVNIVITKNNVGDCSRFKSLINPIKLHVNSVRGDKGYDTSDDFEYCKKNDITAIIPVKSNSTPSRRGARQSAVREQFDIPPTPTRLGFFDRPERRDLKQKEWKERTQYGKRWAVEGFYSRYKRIFGEYVFSKKWKNIQKEITTKVNLLNLFIKMR